MDTQVRGMVVQGMTALSLAERAAIRTAALKDLVIDHCWNDADPTTRAVVAVYIAGKRAGRTEGYAEGVEAAYRAGHAAAQYTAGRRIVVPPWWRRVGNAIRGLIP